MTRAFFSAFLSTLFSTQVLAQHIVKEHVDRILVLAMDVSASVTPERFEAQIQGYRSAFEDPSVIRTITIGPYGKVAVIVAQWSGWGQYQQTTEWFVIRNHDDARAFANTVAATRQVFRGSTSIAGAILYSVNLIERAPYTATRQIIDISGDGYDDGNNMPEGDQRRIEQNYRDSGQAIAPLSFARNDACKRGIIINGLSIAGAEDASDLEDYYWDHVVCGRDAFVVNVPQPDDHEQFSIAIKKKIRLELTAGR